ncbi:hypothetical protein FRB94_008075 [Tulasnella sp. JGI-2019a]|nr:hypothetical protein FRB94_008075 [Tulasnella sp. JGI-2019a]
MKEKTNSISVQIQGHASASTASPNTQLLSDDFEASSLSPIFRLPAEIMAQIIHIASHPEGDRRSYDYVKLLHTLAQVCSTWANVILETPSLWSLVFCKIGPDPPDWLTPLKRSRSSLIAVEFNKGRRGMDEAFWPTIKMHSPRWVSLRVSGAVWSESDDIYAPYLDELRIVRSRLQLTVSRDNFPVLSALELSSFGSRDWDSELPSGLRYLNLSTTSNPPSLLQLLNMLSASTHLESLAISDMDSATNNASIRRPLIPLPDLRDLKISELPITVMDMILHSIHAAHCPIVDIGPIHLEIDDWRSPSLIESFIGPSFPAVASFLTSSLYHYSEAIMLKLSTYGYRFIVDGDQDTLYEKPALDVSVVSPAVDPKIIAHWLNDLVESQQQIRLGISFTEQEILDQSVHRNGTSRPSKRSLSTTMHGPVRRSAN